MDEISSITDVNVLHLIINEYKLQNEQFESAIVNLYSELEYYKQENKQLTTSVDDLKKMNLNNQSQHQFKQGINEEIYRNELEELQEDMRNVIVELQRMQRMEEESAVKMDNYLNQIHTLTVEKDLAADVHEQEVFRFRRQQQVYIRQIELFTELLIESRE